jgi:hypothetical protein
MPAKTTTSTKPRARPNTSTTPPKAVSNPAPKSYLVTIPPEVRDSILRHILLLPETSVRQSELGDSTAAMRDLHFEYTREGRTRLRPSDGSICKSELRNSTAGMRYLFFDYTRERRTPPHPSGGDIIDAKLSALASLTRTCKLLYFESVALFYGYHSYIFNSANACTYIEFTCLNSTFSRVLRIAI